MTSTEAVLDQIRGGPTGPKVAAVFDFDGTLIDGYSAAALYAHRFRNFEIGPGELVRTTQRMLGPTMTEHQFAELVEDGVSGWAGRTEADLLELGDRLFAKEIAGTLFHEAWRLVRAHQLAGHTVVIATSATKLQVAPLARELGVHHVLCTRLEVVDGLLTGKVDGRTLWGPGKIDAVREFLATHDVELADSHAYANGDEDVPLLDGVGHPHPVNPQPELAEVAGQRGWPVLSFTSHRAGRFDPKPALRTAALFGTLLGSAGVGAALGVLNGNRRQGGDLAASLVDALAGPLTDINIEVVDEQHAWSHRPAVFLINQQSPLIDLLVTTRVVRNGFSTLDRAGGNQPPVLGTLLDLAGVAFPGRANRRGASQPVRALRAGTSVVVAPESTHSLTPRLGSFEKDGFQLASRAGVPIVPIVIRNAGELMWRNARTVSPGTVQVVVHPPISTAGWTDADLDEQVFAVREAYLNTLDNWPSPRR